MKVLISISADYEIEANTEQEAIGVLMERLFQDKELISGRINYLKEIKTGGLTMRFNVNNR